MSGQGSRRTRIAEAIKQNLAEMIDREVADPRVRAAGLVTVNEVELNRDLSVAHIYVSFYAGQDGAEGGAIEALGRAAGFLRGPLARRLNLKRAPELRFAHDTGPELRARISEIVREDEERRDDDDLD